MSVYTMPDGRTIAISDVPTPSKGTPSLPTLLEGGFELNVKDIIVKKPWVDVRAFGCIGDGVFNNDESLCLAIKYAVNGILYFPVGHYKISKSIILLSNITIIGEGVISRLQTADLDSSYNIFSIIDKEKINIKNITIRGNEHSHNQPGNAVDDGRTNVYISKSKNIGVYDCCLEGIGSNGVYIDNSDSIYINGCDFSKKTSVDGGSYAKGITVFMSKNIKITDNNFRDIDNGIAGGGDWSDASLLVNNIISNNSFDNIKEHCIYSSQQGVSITSNVIMRSLSGIKVRSVFSNITGNIVNVYSEGIIIAEPSRNCSVVGNIITISSKNLQSINVGINVSSAYLTYFLTNHSSEGCQLSDRMTNIIICSNTISFTKNQLSMKGENIGIRLYAPYNEYIIYDDTALQKVNISNNTISKCETGIILNNYMQDISINNNIITGFGQTIDFTDKYNGHGISFINGYHYYTTISNNQIRKFIHGIFRVEGQTLYNFVNNNFITKNSGYGVNVNNLYSIASSFNNNFLKDNGLGDFQSISPSVVKNNSIFDTNGSYSFG